MAALTLIHGSEVDADAVARKTQECAQALSELALMLPPDDQLKRAVEILSLALKARRSRRPAKRGA